MVGDLNIRASKVIGFYNNDDINHNGKTISKVGKLYEYFIVKIKNQYYLEPNNRIELNSDSVNIGKISTVVWSYKLRIQLKTAYKKGNSIAQAQDLTPENIDFEMYRLGATNQSIRIIPYYEGSMTGNEPIETPNSYGYKTVSGNQHAEITYEKGDDGLYHSFLTIDNLLVNWLSYDNYKIIIHSKGKTGYLSASSGEQTIKFLPSYSYLSTMASKGQHYFNYNQKITLISLDPPTSSVSGRIIYRDPNNPNSAIKPLSNSYVSLLVTYIVDDGKGHKTVVDPYHMRQEMKTHQNSAVSVQEGDMSNSSDNELENSLNHPFDDGNTILKTVMTDANGYFNFKNFADYDSLLTWSNKNCNLYSSGPIEFRTSASIHGKVSRVVRIVVSDWEKRQYIYSPSNNIEIQPLDSIDVGTLTAFSRTYNLSIIPVKSYQNDNEVDKGGIIRGAKINIMHTSDNTDLGDQYVEGANGASFYGLSMHNKSYCCDDYRITISTNDTVGEYTYSERTIDFPRGYDEWKKSKDYPKSSDSWSLMNQQHADYVEKIALDSIYYRNESDFLYVEDYLPVNKTIKIYMDPEQPNISGRILDASNSMRSVDIGNVNLMVSDPRQGSNAPFEFNQGAAVSESLNHGYFVFPNLLPQIENKNIKYKLFIKCNGYNLLSSKQINGKDSITKSYAVNNASIPQGSEFLTLQFGQQINFPQILMQPKGSISGYVVDENGKPVEAYVRTKYGAMQSTFVDNQSNSTSQEFYLQIPTGQPDTVFVYPKDLKYFNEAIPIHPIAESPYSSTTNKYLDSIVVKERRHRMSFAVYDIKTQTPSKMQKLKFSIMKLLLTA